MECANCRGQVPNDGRFCPYCGAPQPQRQPEGDPPPTAPSRGVIAERLAFGALLLLTAAIVVLAILVFVFGFWVEDVAEEAGNLCNCMKSAYPV